MNDGEKRPDHQPVPTNKRRPSAGRYQIHAQVHEDVRRRLKAFTARRGLSDCSVIEAALRQYLDQSSDAALIMRRLDRNGRRIDKVRGDVEILSEFVSLWARLWFAYTPQIPDEQKSAAQKNATARYQQFLGYVEKRLRGTQRLATDLLGEEPFSDTPVGDAPKSAEEP